MNIDEKILGKAERMAEDLLDEFGSPDLALTAIIAVAAMIGRKVYSKQEHYEAFVQVVITSLMTAPKGSPL